MVHARVTFNGVNINNIFLSFLILAKGRDIHEKSSRHTTGLLSILLGARRGLRALCEAETIRDI